MRLTQKQIAEKLVQHHRIEVPGCVLISLAEVLKERHQSLDKALEIARALNMSAAHIKELEDQIEESELMGGFSLMLIAKAFGQKFMEDYTDGKIMLPPVKIVEKKDETPASKPGGTVH